MKDDGICIYSYNDLYAIYTLCMLINPAVVDNKAIHDMFSDNDYVTYMLDNFDIVGLKSAMCLFDVIDDRKVPILILHDRAYDVYITNTLGDVRCIIPVADFNLQKFFTPLNAYDSALGYVYALHIMASFYNNNKAYTVGIAGLNLSKGDK